MIEVNEYVRPKNGKIGIKQEEKMNKKTFEFGENYYYISHCVGCEPDVSKNQNCDDLDKDRIAKGNCYKTKKQAEVALKSYIIRVNY